MVTPTLSSLKELLSSGNGSMNLPEDLKSSALRKYLKLIGAQQMVMTADLHQMLRRDHRLVDRVENELLAGDETMPDDTDENFVLADNITIGTKEKVSLPKIVAAAILGAAIPLSAAAGYMLAKPKPQPPPTFTDTDTTSTIRPDDQP